VVGRDRRAGRLREPVVGRGGARRRRGASRSSSPRSVTSGTRSRSRRSTRATSATTADRGCSIPPTASSRSCWATISTRTVSSPRRGDGQRRRGRHARGAPLRLRPPARRGGGRRRPGLAGRGGRPRRATAGRCGCRAGPSPRITRALRAKVAACCSHSLRSSLRTRRQRARR